MDREKIPQLQIEMLREPWEGGCYEDQRYGVSHARRRSPVLELRRGNESHNHGTGKEEGNPSTLQFNMT